MELGNILVSALGLCGSNTEFASTELKCLDSKLFVAAGLGINAYVFTTLNSTLIGLSTCQFKSTLFRFKVALDQIRLVLHCLLRTGALE